MTTTWGLFGLKMLHGGWEVSLRCYGNGACITFFTGWRRLGSMQLGDEAEVPVLITIMVLSGDQIIISDDQLMISDDR